MWKKVAALLIVLSVALNIAFISAWAVRAGCAHWPTAATSREDAGHPLYRRLNVTEEQRKQLEPGIAEFRTRSQTICEELNRLRTELIDLIASDELDRDAIAAKQDVIRAGQQRMQELVVEHLLAQRRVLTAEQQQELFRLIRQHSACHGPGRMMGFSGMPPSTGGRQDQPQE